MAERPDPDTDRRNILPGEHAKPDGTWCPYLAPSNEAGVWVCMKCGNSGGVSTPDTDPNTLADRLDGKPAQESTVTIDDKRDATDWSRSELVAFLNDARAGSNGTAAKDGRGGKPDKVH